MIVYHLMLVTLTDLPNIVPAWVSLFAGLDHWTGIRLDWTKIFYRWRERETREEGWKLSWKKASLLNLMMMNILTFVPYPC